MQLLQERQLSIQLTRWLFVALLAPALCHCDTTDIGKLCGDANASIPVNTITGEQPTVELVRLDRDPNCLTFQCLTHHGLPPYCTQQCTYNKPAKSPAPKSCAADSDCTAPLHCHAGICNNDNCPTGFWCQTVQDVGPYTGQLFCVRRDNCKTDFDCGSLGSIACTTMGCFDKCNLTNTTCSYHQLVCEPESNLGCKCADGSHTCMNPSNTGNAALLCQPPGETQPLPAGSITQEGICLPKS